MQGILAISFITGWNYLAINLTKSTNQKANSRIYTGVFCDSSVGKESACNAGDPISWLTTLI